jgi:hypothetical protein
LPNWKNWSGTLETNVWLIPYRMWKAIRRAKSAAVRQQALRDGLAIVVQKRSAKQRIQAITASK